MANWIYTKDRLPPPGYELLISFARKISFLSDPKKRHTAKAVFQSHDKTFVITYPEYELTLGVNLVYAWQPWPEAPPLEPPNDDDFSKWLREEISVMNKHLETYIERFKSAGGDK